MPSTLTLMVHHSKSIPAAYCGVVYKACFCPSASLPKLRRAFQAVLCARDWGPYCAAVPWEGPCQETGSACLCQTISLHTTQQRCEQLDMLLSEHCSQAPSLVCSSSLGPELQQVCSQQARMCVTQTLVLIHDTRLICSALRRLQGQSGHA